MENTGKVLFENDQPQWYIALGERWMGPLSAADVYQKILASEITWAHFVWKTGQPDWKRICDVKTFQAAVPTLPAKTMQQEVKDASKPNIVATQRSTTRAAAQRKVAPAVSVDASEGRIWFLFYNESQYGPFSSEEISRFLQVGKIHGRVHIWRDGLADWARLETIERFAGDVAESKRVRDQKKTATPPAAPGGAKPTKVSKQEAKAEEQRRAPRMPLVAKILMANQQDVMVAVCRDISIGGMQVLTDQIPGKSGDRIKLNVSPAGRGSSGEGTDIEAFVAEGVIVRILEDGRGFSFRFDRLPDSSRKAIEKYIQIAGS